MLMTESGEIFAGRSSQTEYTEEGAPLMPACSTAKSANSESKRDHYGSVADAISSQLKRQEVFSVAHNNKLIYYDHNLLLSWTTFGLMGKSVFLQGPVAKTFIFCISLAAGLAVIVYFIPSASKIDTQRFQYLCDFLTVFISFMLGIYVQQGFKHWWCSVTTFEKVLSSIRQLIFMLHQIKPGDKFVREVEELCLASTYILNAEIKTSNTVLKLSSSNTSHDLETLARIEQLEREANTTVHWLGKHGFLTADEEDVLKNIKASAGVMTRTRAVWGFVGEMLAHMTDLTGKTLPPPVETRLISLCQECIEEIEELKMNLTMQTPFMYAHLLSFLVHVNNFILSASCGISIGSAVNETVLRGNQIFGDSAGRIDSSDVTDSADVFLRQTNPTSNAAAASTFRNFYAAIQTTWIQIIMVTLTPILHVAFLHIAHLLCYPFGDDDYHLPIETLIARLHSELNQMTLYRKAFRDTLDDKKARNIDGAGQRQHASVAGSNDDHDHDENGLRGDDDDAGD